jgi:hypothetical protein
MYRFTILVALVLSSSVLFAQDVKYVKLQKEKTPLRLLSFHIAAVKDTRPDTSSKIGSLQPVFGGKKSTILKMSPGVQKAFSEFIRTSYKQDTATSAVELQIHSIQIAHTRKGLKSHLEVTVGMDFLVDGEKITDYDGEGASEGSGDPLKPLEELIRKNLENGLEKFDAWWQKNKSQYLATKGAPTTVVVEPTIATTDTDKGMIVYSASRPLTYEDFTGEMDDLSRAAAATHTGIQMNLSSVTKNGTATVKVTLLPYFDKNHSWFRTANRNAKTLLHEQKHFDITALKACDLVETIRKASFTADFARELEALHKQNDREWDKLQRAYDEATNHGQNNSAQQKWNKTLQEQLAKCPCRF